MVKYNSTSNKGLPSYFDRIYFLQQYITRNVLLYLGNLQMYKNGFAAKFRKNKISAIMKNISTLVETVPSELYMKCVVITDGIIPKIRRTFMINTVVKNRF